MPVILIVVAILLTKSDSVVCTEQLHFVKLLWQNIYNKFQWFPLISAEPL